MLVEGMGVMAILGGGFKHFLFSPLPGEMIQFDYSNTFQIGSKPPTSYTFSFNIFRCGKQAD